MDDIDFLALRLLVRQGRMTWADLAHQLKLSSPAAAERVRRLEEKGVIRGYAALVDRSALGYGLTAFVGVELTHSSHRAAFDQRVGELAEVLECHHVTGDHDCLLKVACRNPVDLDHLLSVVLKASDIVKRTRTLIVLGTPKESQFAPPDRPAAAGPPSPAAH